MSNEEQKLQQEQAEKEQQKTEHAETVAEETISEDAVKAASEDEASAGAVEGEVVDQDEVTAEVEAQADETAVYIAELEAAVQVAEAKVIDQRDSVIRAQAEVENIRRRSAQEVEKARKFALEKFANELLPVIDNMQRGLEHVDHESEEHKALIEGVQMTMDSLLAAVNKFGVEEVNPEGETFNPELHQAMSMVPNPDLAPNTVIAVMQKGYTLNGRLLRPAMVMVSSAG